MEIGGNKPEIVVDGRALIGNEVTVGVKTITEGGILLAPIPAEFLRLPEKNPQVKAIILWSVLYSLLFILFLKALNAMYIVGIMI